MIIHHICIPFGDFLSFDESTVDTVIDDAEPIDINDLLLLLLFGFNLPYPYCVDSSSFVYSVFSVYTVSLNSEFIELIVSDPVEICLDLISNCLLLVLLLFKLFTVVDGQLFISAGVIVIVGCDECFILLLLLLLLFVVSICICSICSSVICIAFKYVLSHENNRIF